MKIIVVSHGDFSKGLVSSVQMVVGEQKDLVAYGVYPQEDREELTKKIKHELVSKSTDEDVLVLSDIFHGTPFNVSVALMEYYDFYHVTGVNLPMLVEILMKRSAGNSCEEICDEIISIGAASMKDVRNLLKESEET